MSFSCCIVPINGNGNVELSGLDTELLGYTCTGSRGKQRHELTHRGPSGGAGRAGRAGRCKSAERGLWDFPYSLGLWSHFQVATCDSQVRRILRMLPKQFQE